MKRFVLAFVVALLTSCLPATQTIVELTVSQDLVGRDGDLTVLVINEEGHVVFSEDFVIDASWNWPAEIPISPRDGDASRRFTFTATFREEGGRIVVRAALGFAEGTQFRVRLSFDESCRDQECGPGFTCELGECISVFRPGEECDLPPGSACDVGTGCGCPAGYSCAEIGVVYGSATARTTCVPRAPATPCTGASECEPDEQCNRDGECQPASTTLCEREVSGTSGLGESCSPGECRTDLACVLRSSLDDDLDFSFTGTGFCSPGCNLCQSDATCPSPHECIALPGGGGVCSRNGIALETETCDSTRYCARGLSCRSDRCVRLCRGQFAPGGAMGRPICAIRSADCGADELCTGSRSDLRIGICEAGAAEFPSPEGGLCTLDSKCPCPLACVPTGRAQHLFCAQRADSTCDVCPDNTDCAERIHTDGRVYVACVVPGSLRDFDECDNARQCESGYCSTDDICLRAP